ncbi:hypothetical protein [Paraburkholderia sp. CI3]|uniref:hypothetical protein n=1 Tax=Paraburkholderia sp. CI3 TaxID=2991060 RepID=UPI003D1E8DBE
MEMKNGRAGIDGTIGDLGLVGVNMSRVLAVRRFDEERCQAKVANNPFDMRGRITEAKLALDQDTNLLTGPDID